MSPTSRARLRDARALAALGLAAGIAVPAALLAGPQAAARPVAPAPAAPVSLTAGAAAGAGAGAVAADAADAGEEQPVCGDPDAKEFPIEARIQDAPRTYVSGGGYGTWFLDLTNTTGTACGALHPVLVLSDGERRLTADQIQLKFSEPGRTDTEHRATWETTDRHEQIGVFDGSGPGSDSDSGPGSNSGSDSDDFLGFTVPAGGTISVRVRMAFGSETGPARVTAHAAVVQRRHQDKAKGGGREDGDWVGESGAYRFVVVDGATGEYPRPEATGTEEDGGRTDVPAAPRPRTDTSSGAPTPAPTYTGPGKESAPESGTRPPTRPDGSVSPRSDADADAAADADAGSDADEDRGGRLEGDGSGGKEQPARPPHYDTGRPLPELARTGPELLPWAGALAGILILCGGVLVAQGRRMRRAAD
ncbi:peptidase [Streptomyces bacillaris]|uniref:peptidase n=1 Tax=Streptomyces bacillaris TaxID=68179 RepID=UPI0036B2FCAE